jgi:hypothetical protein
VEGWQKLIIPEFEVLLAGIYKVEPFPKALCAVISPPWREIIPLAILPVQCQTLDIHYVCAVAQMVYIRSRYFSSTLFHYLLK